GIRDRNVTGVQTCALPICVPGEDAQGTELAVDFLRQATEDQSRKISGKVLVIGGGNVAVDCARTAARFGAGQVRMVCLESRETKIGRASCRERGASEWGDE